MNHSDQEFVDTAQLTQLLELQQFILGSIATGERFEHIIEQLCGLIGSMVPDASVSVMLLKQETEVLTLQAGPAFLTELLPYFETILPAGSDAVYVTDVASDSRLNGLREAVLRLSIGACWSIPIVSDEQEILGTLAVAFAGPQIPTPFHKRILETAAYAAAITIKNWRREQRLLQWSTVFDDANEGMYITGSDGSILDVNKAFTRITGYNLEEVHGNNPKMMSSERHDETFYKTMWGSINTTGKWQGEIWNRRKDGEIYPQWLSVSRIGNRQGQAYNYVAVFSDISLLKESEHKLFYLAHHDALTGLPNRLLMNARLEHVLGQAKRNPTCIAVMFIDLDRFKYVNDTYGHAQGDRVLINVAKRLRSLLREQDTIARIGGDEFVVILEGLAQSEDAANLAQKFIDALEQPFQLADNEVFVTPSIGITIFPEDGRTSEILLKNADIAMYRAKEQGRHGFSFYKSSMTDKVRERLSMETYLRRALERNQFELFYQPQVLAGSPEIVGVEALLRWHHPELGLVMPGDFIPILEETHLIESVGEWELSEACRKVRQWDEQGLPRVRLAVNLSARQMLPSSLGRNLGMILRVTGFDPRRLELEITEHSLMNEGERIVGLLEALGDLGVSLAIDDFGSGYSSLARLKRLPVQCLKIDSKLVRDVSVDASDQMICQAIVALGHSLGMRVIAEGVERSEQSRFLKSIKCDEFQGYLYGRPVPAFALEKMLREQANKSIPRASS